MWDRQNGIMVRAGYVFAPQATNPIQLGQVGQWVDLNNVRWDVSADGSQKAVGSGSAAVATAVRLATASALPSYAYSSATQTITASANGVWTIDGKALNVGDRILKVTAGGATDDGIYTVTVKGTASVKTVLTRVADMSTSGSLVPGMLIPVGPDGTANAGNLYQLMTGAPIVLDTTVLEFGAEANNASSGVIPAARVAFSANPANNDTIAIGGTTFKFVTALGSAAAQVQVLIGASAAATLASLLSAINNVTSDVTWVQATSPFALLVVADAVTATVLRLRKATAQGGAAVAGTVASTALTASVTGGASAWSVANLNASGRFPKVVITAAMITNGSFQAELDYTPSAVAWTVTSSVGVLRSITDAVTISANAINIALAGGASPATQAGDILSFFAPSS